MGNRAKKTKKGLVRPLATKVLAAPVTCHSGSAATTVVQAADNKAPSGVSNPSPRGDKVRIADVKTSTIHWSRYGKLASLHSHTVRITDRSKIHRSLVAGHFQAPPSNPRVMPTDPLWCSRKIIPIAELSCPFPEDAENVDSDLEEYKRKVAAVRDWQNWQRYLEECNAWLPMREYAQGSEMMQDLGKCHSVVHAQGRYHNLRSMETSALMRDKDSLQQILGKPVEQLRMMADQLTPDTFFKTERRAARAIMWQNGDTKGVIAFPKFDPNKKPDTLVAAGAPPLNTTDSGFKLAGKMAFGNARYHRMYSEAMGLIHSPFCVIRKACCPGNPQLERTQAREFLARQRAEELAPKLENFNLARSKVFSPLHNSDFHPSRIPLCWITALNGAMNVYADLPEEEQRVIKRRIAGGEDDTSFYVYDIRELGHLMNALRGYYDPEANARTGTDLRVPGTVARQTSFIDPPSRRVRVNHLGEDGGPEADLPKDAIPVPQRKPFLEIIPGDTVLNDRFIIDEQRGLQAIQFHHEMTKLPQKLQRTIGKDLHARALFDMCRQPDGAQHPPLATRWRMGVRAVSKIDLDLDMKEYNGPKVVMTREQYMYAYRSASMF